MKERIKKKHSKTAEIIEQQEGEFIMTFWKEREKKNNNQGGKIMTSEETLTQTGTYTHTHPYIYVHTLTVTFLVPQNQSFGSAISVGCLGAGREDMSNAMGTKWPAFLATTGCEK